jgi:hypothetical protein
VRGIERQAFRKYSLLRKFQVSPDTKIGWGFSRDLTHNSYDPIPNITFDPASVENKDFLTPYALQHHGCPHLSNVKGSPQSNDVKCELRNAKTISRVGRCGDFVAGFGLSFPAAVNPEPLVRMAADFLLNDRGVLLRGEAEGVLPAGDRWLDGG